MRKKRQKKSYAAISLKKFLSSLRLISNLKSNTIGGYNAFIIGENIIINGLWSDNNSKFYISSAYGIDRVDDNFINSILEKYELPSTKTNDIDSEMNYYQIIETKKGELK